MTAEERAAAFSWAQCPGGEGHDAGDDGVALMCAKCHANLIRSAEDDALERAAKAIELGADPSNIIGFMQVEHAKVIRRLKTGGAK